MTTRSIWIYLVVALVLAGLYFFDTQSNKEKVAQKISSTTMFDIEPSVVTSFSIIKGDTAIRVERSGKSDMWAIRHPIQTKADRLRVEKFLEKISRLRWVRKITGSPKELGPFGLDKPPVIISFKGKGTSGSLRIGSLTPLGDDVYVQRDYDPAVYTIGFADKFDLDVDLFDLRDKRLVTIPPKNALRLTIERKDEGPWVFEKKAGNWIFADSGFEADQERIYGVLSRLWTLRATSIAVERAKNLRRFGLEDPVLRIKVSNGTEEQELLVGNASGEDNDLYAKMARKPQVVTVRNWILSDIPPTEMAFRKPGRKS